MTDSQTLPQRRPLATAPLCLSLLNTRSRRSRSITRVHGGNRWLKSQGLEHQEICRLAGLSSNTLRKYLRLFQAGGIKKLTELNFYAPASELERHRYQLETYFREHPPATLNEAAARIEELTGLRRSPSAVGRFLNALGMAPRRIGTIPSKADPEEQERFRVNELEPRLDQARQGKRAIFLSMLLTSCWVPFSGFCGHFPVSL